MKLSGVLDYHILRIMSYSVIVLSTKNNTNRCLEFGVLEMAANCVSKVNSLSTIKIVSNMNRMSMCTLISRCTGYNRLWRVLVPLGAMSGQLPGSLKPG